MKTLTPPSCLVLLCAAACGNESPNDSGPAASGPQTVMVMTTTYETSSVDAFSTEDPTKMRRCLILAAGDATIRQIGNRALVLNRGDASNVQVINEDLTPGTQIAVPGCGPHDALLLDDGRVLLTCYDDVSLRLVDLEGQTCVTATDLSAFADADGLPEMDQMLRVGDRIYVSLQRLDQDHAPTGNGIIGILDAQTLELVDTNLAQPGEQGHDLPLVNPYTRLVLGANGLIYVGSVGDWLDHSTMGVMSLDPTTGETEVAVAGATMGGPPSAIARNSAGVLFALVSIPNGWVPTEMQLLRLAGSTPEVLYNSPGYTLAGVAVDAEGRAYVGNRSPDENAGLWIIDPLSGQQRGPFATCLPPFDIEIF
ncbi:hypothetical protein ACFL6C_03535 [Myxococcota bacterium]